MFTIFDGKNDIDLVTMKPMRTVLTTPVVAFRVDSEETALFGALTPEKARKIANDLLVCALRAEDGASACIKLESMGATEEETNNILTQLLEFDGRSWVTDVQED